MKTNSMPLLLASIAVFVMTMTGYSKSPPKVTVRRRTSPLRLPWPDAAMLAAILLPCAAISSAGASPPAIVVTATTARGFPVNGATTTFSDTLSVQSLPITVRLDRQGSILTLSWIGGTGPYRIQKATNLTLTDWQDYLTNTQSPVTLEADDPIGFYRVVEP